MTDVPQTRYTKTSDGGLQYVDSWIDVSLRRGFQLMACEDVRLLQEWVANWTDLTTFEIVPVVPSKETVEVMRAI